MGSKHIKMEEIRQIVKQMDMEVFSLNASSFLSTCRAAVTGKPVYLLLNLYLITFIHLPTSLILLTFYIFIYTKRNAGKLDDSFAAVKKTVSHHDIFGACEGKRLQELKRLTGKVCHLLIYIHIIVLSLLSFR